MALDFTKPEYELFTDLTSLDKLQTKISQLEESIEKDKSNGLDVSKKTEFLLLYKSDFYNYYCQMQKL